MAENKIAYNEPGLAGFASESYSGPIEPRFGEGVQDTIHVPVVASGAVDLPIYSVVAYTRSTGAIALATLPSSVSNAYGILVAPLLLADTQTASVPLAVAGHWEMSALNWGSAFDTDAKKLSAFEKSAHPGILVSKKKFSNDAIDIPN